MFFLIVVGKNRRVGVVGKPQLDRVKSTPEIRITRPSICILPEFQLDTNQPIKCECNMEELLSDEDADVEVEPLDLGKYDSTTNVCDTTFEVEKTETEPHETETDGSESKNSDFESNKDEGSSNDVDDKLYEETASDHEPQISDTTNEQGEMQNNTESVPHEEQQEEVSGVSENITSDEKDGVENEKVTEAYGTDSDKESEDIKREDEQKTESFSADMANVVFSEPNEPESSQDLQTHFIGEDKISVNRDFVEKGDSSDVIPAHKDGGEGDELMENDSSEKEGRKTERADEDEQGLPVDSAKSDENLKTSTGDGTIPKEETVEVFEGVSETTGTSPQAEPQNPDSSLSDTSPSPSSTPEGIVGRKKKKLLLRSSSSDAMPRMRALHSCHSLDSEQLSSSLNFSSRLGQRTAALLLELRSEIASLTARQLSDDYYDSEEPESATTTDSAVTKDPAAVTIKDDDKPLKNKSDTVISDIKANEAKSLTSSDSGISCQDLGSKDSEIAPKGCTADNDMRTEDTSLATDVKVTTQRDLLGNDSETVRKKDFSVNPDEVGSEENRHKDIEGSQSNDSVADKPSPRPASFTMPVFEDIEKNSFSLDDFMEDSLEHGDDDDDD